MAEGAGFEPAVACATEVFKTSALNHSTTPPQAMDVSGLAVRNSPKV